MTVVQRASARLGVGRLAPATLALATLTAVGLVVVASPAHAATSYTWTGGAGLSDTSWSNAANWSPAGVPGTGDSASISPPSPAKCTETGVTGAPSGTTLANLTLADAEFTQGTVCFASLTGGPLSVSGFFTQHGATLQAPVTVLAGATSVISPTTSVPDPTQIIGSLTIAGLLNIAATTAGSQIVLGPGAGLSAAPGGTIVSSGDNVVTATTCCGNPAHLTNDGTLRVDGGELRVASVALDQKGVLDTTSPTSSLRTEAAPSTSDNGASFTGSGSWQLGAGSTTAFGGLQTVAPGFEVVLGGPGVAGSPAVLGDFALVGGGLLDWRSGRFAANLTIGADMRVSATGPGTRSLVGQDEVGTPLTLSNHGRLAISGASVRTVSGGHIDNYSDGTLTLGSGALSSAASDPGTLRNLGGSIVVARSGFTLNEVSFSSYGGTISSTGGTLALTGQAPAFLEQSPVLVGGVLSVGVRLAATGKVGLGAGSSLSLVSPGSLTGAASLVGPGAFDWAGGTLAGRLVLSPGRGSTLRRQSGAVKRVIAGGAQPSTVRFTTRTVVEPGSAKVANTLGLATGSVLTFAGPTTLGAGSVVNGGTVRTTGATTAAARSGLPVLVRSALVNSGALSIRAGQLKVAGSYTQATGSLAIRLLAKALAPLSVTGPVALRGRLLVANAFAPKARARRTVVTASKLTLGLRCTTTSGVGSSGPRARHWSAARTGRQVVLTWVPGRRTSC